MADLSSRFNTLLYIIQYYTSYVKNIEMFITMSDHS
jgi:hypothetical protein